MEVKSRQRPLGSNPVYWASFRDAPPGGWMVTLVAQMAQTFKGKLPSTIFDMPTDRTKPYLLMEGLRGGGHVFTEDTDLPSVTEIDTVVIADGSKSGFAVRGFAGVLGSTLLAFRARPGTHPSFLFHLLSSLFSFLNSATTGTAIPHLDQDLLLRLPLAVPPKLEEQAAIAQILDAVETAIVRTRQAVERARELRDSLTHQLLHSGLHKEKLKKSEAGIIPKSWDCEPLGQHVESGPTNGVYRPDSDYGTRGTRIVRIDSFDDGHIHNLAALRRVKVEPIIEDRYALAKDDLLINRVNSLSHIGKAAIVPSLDEPTIFESNMMRLRCGPRLLPEFLILVLCSDISRRHWLSRAKPAVNQASINQRDVNALPVPTPKRDEQKEIARILSASAEHIERLNSVKLAQETLKESLMHDLLTGKVRVKNLNLESILLP